MNRSTLSDLVDALGASEPVVVATLLASGEHTLLRPLADGPPHEWLEHARRALLEDRAITLESPGGDVFLRPYNPAVRVIVVGAVHVAQSLSRMATEAGYQVTVIDPRRAFATEERFPTVDLRHVWPAEGMEELVPDHRTAVVALTHDPKLDDPALVSALATRAFYVGALGSRRTHAKRVQRLSDQGVAAESIERIHAPVGLDIGARTPEEIAVAVLAQIVQALRAPAP